MEDEVKQEENAEQSENSAQSENAAQEEGKQEEEKQEEEVKQHEFDDLKEDSRKSAARDIEFLLDIPLEITVQLGKTRMMIKDLLQLGQGSVIELEKVAGEPMEILANKRLVARGEVVVVNEKFGVRLTDIVSPKERVSKLK